MNESGEEEGRASGRAGGGGQGALAIRESCMHFAKGPMPPMMVRERDGPDRSRQRHSQPNDEIARNGEGREPPSTRGAPFEIQ